MDTNAGLRRLVLCLLLLGILRLFFLKDIPFINDEALLIKQALRDNEAGVLTTHGLMGSRGVDYGPFALWFYRIALFFSHQILLVAALKVIFVSTLTAVSLILITRHTPGLSPLLGAIAFLSPYLWFYARDLWDNSFVIPLSALALSTYITFLKTKRLPFLFVSALSLSFGFLTHLVFLPILLGTSLHFLLFRPLPFSIKRWGQLALILFMPALPYLVHLLAQHPGQKFAPGDLGHVIMPFTGPRFFTGFGLEYFLGPQWYQVGGTPFAYVWKALLAISLLAYPIFVVGLIKTSKDTLTKKPGWEIWTLLLFCFLFQCLLSWTYRLIPIPNFHSSLWLIYFVVIWKTLSEWGRVGQWVSGAIAISLLASLIGMTSLIHHHGGNRENHYGPTLGNLNQIAATLNQFPPQTPIHPATRHSKEFPWALEALQELLPKYETSAKVASVTISYLRPELSQDGRITILTAGAEKP